MIRKNINKKVLEDKNFELVKFNEGYGVFTSDEWYWIFDSFGWYALSPNQLS